jgi:pyruvate dehydrogenase E2 component (dihydrolipoyllysine-residue acetyltransferase)
MPRPFVLPDLGEGLAEAEIVKVLVKEGDLVGEDTPLLEVETDKAQVEIPSPMSGRVLTIHVEPHQTVKVGAVLVTFADVEETLRSAAATGPAAIPAAPAPRAPAAIMPPASAESHRGPVPATPATRRLARELRVDLRLVRGTGAGGRVTDDDVRAAAAQPDSRLPLTSPPAAERARPTEPSAAARPLTVSVEVPPLPRFEQWGPVERQPLSHLRRTIADRMTLSATVIPHVTHFDRADITELDAIIARNLEPARAHGVTLTLTSFLLKALALALREHPQFNASLDGATGEMILKRYYHLGVAVATERGLIVPVIRDVDRKPVLELARELAALATRVREGKATLDDLRGGTCTITNLGGLGGTGAIPIINYPEVAILGVARARLEPVVREGQIVPRMLLPLSLTFDHRVADGVDGARLAAAIIGRLEHPEQLLLEL